MKQTSSESKSWKAGRIWLQCAAGRTVIHMPGHCVRLQMCEGLLPWKKDLTYSVRPQRAGLAGGQLEDSTWSFKTKKSFCLSCQNRHGLTSKVGGYCAEACPWSSEPVSPKTPLPRQPGVAEHGRVRMSESRPAFWALTVMPCSLFAGAQKLTRHIKIVLLLGAVLFFRGYFLQILASTTPCMFKIYIYIYIAKIFLFHFWR